MYRLIIIFIIGFALLMWLGYDSQSAFEKCKAAGIQSDETCRAYAL